MKKNMLTGSLLLNALLIALLLFFIHKIGGFRFLLYKLKTNEVASNYQHLKNQFDNLKIDSTDIIFLGNSLTHYGNWNEFFPNQPIKNRGIPGDVTEGILKRLSPILLPKPRKIFLMIGVNDLLFHSPERALKYYDEIVKKIQSKSPQTKLFLQSCLPVNSQVRSIPITNQDILILNSGIKQIAEKQHVTYINLHPLFLDSKGRLDEKYTNDGIHLDSKGYQVWKDFIEKWVVDE